MQAQEVKQTEWPQHSVEAALLALSSVDQDYARVQNGVGFNGMDTEFGNSLASKLVEWGHLTFRQRRAAHKMLRKYRGQLLRNFGISYDDIPIPVENETPATKVKGQVWLRGTELILDSPYNADLVNTIRVMPVRRWDTTKGISRTGQKGVWIIPLSIDNIPEMRKLVETHGLDMDPEAARALDESMGHLEAMVEGSRALSADVDLPAGLGVTLLPFQEAAVAFARKVLPTGGLYIADEMGLGKTVEALVIAEDQGAFPLLVGVPKVVWLNWAKECRKVVPSRSVAMLAPTTITKNMMKMIPEGVEIIPLPKDEDEATRVLLKPGTGLSGFSGEWRADIFVVAYPNLLKWSPALMEVPWKGLVYDEAHLLKSRAAQRTKAAKGLAKLADTKMLLSGTPIPNAPSELITQIEMLERMEDLGGWKKFWYGYCGGWKGGHRNEEELNVKMRSTFYQRRTRPDVYPELPAVRWIPVSVPMRDPGRYEQTEEDFIEFIRAKVEHDEETIKLLAEIEDDDLREQRKREIIDEKYERSMRAQVLTLINALRQVVAEEKLPAFYEWLDAWLETTLGNGHSLQGERSKKIIVFTDHRPISQEIAAKYGAPLIIGGMDDGKKAQIEAAFQNDPNVRVLVCSTQAAGLGLTLTAATDVAFVEFQWRPLDMDQAVSRTYGRVNDLHGATAFEIVVPGTIDDRMREKIDKKRDVTGRVSDGGSVMTSVLRDLLRLGKEKTA